MMRGLGRRLALLCGALHERLAPIYADESCAALTVVDASFVSILRTSRIMTNSGVNELSHEADDCRCPRGRDRWFADGKGVTGGTK